MGLGQHLDELTKSPEFGLSLATHAWSQGCEFSALEMLTDVDPGDLCRNFRLAVQLLRQTIKAVDGDERLITRLRGAIQHLDQRLADFALAQSAQAGGRVRGSARSGWRGRG